MKVADASRVSRLATKAYDHQMLNTFRIIATSVFGIITFIIGSFLSTNIRKLASERGWDNLLVHGWDKLPQQWRDALRWERLQRLWWLWFIFGGSGGVALALWISPVLTPPSVQWISLLTAARTLGPADLRREFEQSTRQLQDLLQGSNVLGEGKANVVDSVR